MVFFNEREHPDLVEHELFCSRGAAQNQICLVPSTHCGAVKIRFSGLRGETFNPVNLPVAPVKIDRLRLCQLINHGIGQVPRLGFVLTKVDTVTCRAARVIRIPFGNNVTIVAPVALLISRLVA